VSSWPSAVRGARRRVGEASWSIVQTPVAAGLAWYIAHNLLGHHDPFFAPVAAAVALSKVRVLRAQRALQLIVGVVLGIGVGTAVKAVAGPDANGAVAIAVATLIAVAAAVSLGGGFFEQGVLFVNQSASSAILMIAVTGTATGSERFSDALIGGGVTLVIVGVLFPAAPLPLIQHAAGQVFTALRDALAGLAHFADTGTTAGPEWALAAGQRIHDRLAGLDQARSDARQIAMLAPRRWPDRPRARRLSQQTAPLHLLAAPVLGLVHASIAPPTAPPPLDRALREALHELASALAILAAPAGATHVADATRAAPHAAHARSLASDAQADDAARAGDAHSQLIARLIQTCADDTLRYTST
jgi:uncharacterized membrane protein YgaE (UPF0421/DUF939 family)